MILARAGQRSGASCTLRYAPPEVVRAVDARGPIAVAPAADVWALGVIGYETLAAAPVFASVQDIFACGVRGQQYPWESAEPPSGWRESRLRPIIERCLVRDPNERATVDGILSAVQRLTQSTAAHG